MENSLGFQACIFDFDGIVVDSEYILVQLWVKTAREHHYPFEARHFFPCLGRTREDAKRIQLRTFGEDFPYDEIFQQVQERFREIIQEKGLPLVPGVLELRQFIEDAHIKLAIASSTYRAEVLFRMEKAGIAHLFPLVLGGDEIQHPKPAPDIFLKTADSLHIAPFDCLVIEDSQSGVLAAKAAGMHVVVVQNLSPLTPRIRQKADAIFPSHAELLKDLQTRSLPFQIK